nr:GNAT family N-acetyltransferase [uncultured Gellertiella sp.]
MYFVRTAHERDLDAIRNLLLAAYHFTYDALYGVDKVNELNADWNAADQLNTLIKDPGGEFLVADNGRSIGGVAYACMSTRTPHTAALVKLYVHPDCLRLGIGRDLLAEMETCFPDATRMRLQVDPGNSRAIAFYETHGFAVSGRTENCGSGESGIPALLMEKPLADL